MNTTYITPELIAGTVIIAIGIWIIWYLSVIQPITNTEARYANTHNKGRHSN